MIKTISEQGRRRPKRAVERSGQGLSGEQRENQVPGKINLMASIAPAHRHIQIARDATPVFDTQKAHIPPTRECRMT
jgi:hypothetical protein